LNYLIAIIALALPSYLIRFSIWGLPTTLLEILIYLGFICGLLNLKKAQKVSLKFWIPVGLMLAAALISVFISPLKSAALGQFKAIFLDPIIVAWLMLAYLKKEDFPLVFSGLIGSSLIVSLYNIFEKLAGNVTVDNRVVGIFGYSPNYVALFLSPIIGMVLAHNLELMTKKVAIQGKAIKLIMGWLVTVLGLVAIYFSASRGGLLALIGGLVFYFLLRFWSKIKSSLVLKIGLVIIVILMVTVAWSVFRPNFSLSPSTGGRVTSSDNVRWQIWQTSWELGLKHPILGLGLANYQNAFNQLTKNRVNFSTYITPLALSSHNIFFMFWLSTGTLGLISFFWLLINFFSIGGWNAKKPMAVVLMVGMMVLLLQGLVDTPYFKNDLSLLFWLLFALMLLL
jgi:putative inorganic carbon (HCO3(-)) transporter